jgi:hypothetical protein
MKRSSIPLALVVLLLLTSVTLADTDSHTSKTAQDYEISWWTVDGGGDTASGGGSYALGGTIGQSDAGASSGGSYALSSGFWTGWRGGYAIFLPLVLRSH